MRVRVFLVCFSLKSEQMMTTITFNFTDNKKQQQKEEKQIGTPLFQTDEGRYLAASKCSFPLKID